jgi:hypothetical protein
MRSIGLINDPNAVSHRISSLNPWLHRSSFRAFREVLHSQKLRLSVLKIEAKYLVLVKQFGNKRRQVRSL